MRISGYRGYGCMVGLCILLMLLLSCESRDKYAGTYKAEGRVEIILELHGTGDGLWKVGSDEVSFAWYTKRGELRLNTKGGGVIVGKIDKDAIRMTLPGSKVMTFKKIQ
jgi:hypothetical protein